MMQMEFVMKRTKELILVLLVLVLLLGSLMHYTAAQAQAGTVVRVEPGTISAQINETFDAFIRVENVSGLTAFEIHLTFNPAVLEVVELANGGFLVADFTVQNTFDNTAGTIDYAIAQLNTSPADGSGALLRIRFRGKANGASNLSLRSIPAAPSGLLLANANGDSIPFAWTGATFSVGTGQGPTQVPPTPTPTAEITPVPATETSTTPESPADPTVTPTPTVTATPSTPTEPVSAVLGTHKVRWGETLYCIGRGYGVNPWAIARVNNIRWWPYLIFPGQLLTIPNEIWLPAVPAGRVCAPQFTATPVATPVPTVSPPASTPAPTVVAPTATPVPSSQPATCRTYHVVRSGENLFRIGLSYGVPYEEIAHVNGITNPRLIYPGQRLCIP
jgi:LysM repeat protein